MEQNTSYLPSFLHWQQLTAELATRAFVFLINRTDMFSPLKALQLPRVINLLQLNYCTKNTPIGCVGTCATVAEAQRYEYASALSGWSNHRKGSENLQQNSRKRINHCRFTRHSGSQCAFVCTLELKWRSRLSTNYEWIHSLKMEIILVSKENLTLFPITCQLQWWPGLTKALKVSRFIKSQGL